MQDTAGQLFGDGRPGGCCRSVILGPGGQEGAVGWLFGDKRPVGWGALLMELHACCPASQGAPRGALQALSTGSSTLEGEDPLAAPAAQTHPWFVERRNLLC